MLCKRLCWDVLFFCLDAKEKIPKEKLKAAFSPLLHYGEKLKGLELASLRQSPLLTLFASVPFDAAEMRPGDPHSDDSIQCLL